MRKIIFVPLDSRPCNTSWIEKFCVRSNLELIMYPGSLCGSLHTRSNQADIERFILEQSTQADYLLIALDNYCSGGLVQSRLGDFDVNHSKNIKTILKQVRSVNPFIKVYAFDTLMRTTVTSYGYQSSVLWKQINRYSALKGRLNDKYDCDLQAELTTLIGQIDPNDLKKYHNARAKKFSMNQFYIELVHENVIDFLTIVQEDAVEKGIQMEEQNKLMGQINQFGLSHRIKIYNGTDEAASTLLAKIILEVYRIKPKVYIESNDLRILECTFPFEDRPFKTNLDHLFDVIGIKSTTLEACDFVLSIFADDNNRNISLNDTEAVILPDEQNLVDFSKRVNEHIKSTKPVALLDLSFPNGGYDKLLLSLDYLGLSAYSAWNTASNAAGSLLCDMMCVMTGDQTKYFLKERIIDDCFYQYIVRRQINEELLKDNINMFDLGTFAEETLNNVRTLLNKYRDIIHNDFAVTLPWQRTFEIDINVGDTYDI